MADQSVIAAEVLEKSADIFKTQSDKFNAVADNAIAEAKKRVSQLTDFNNRLATALTNLNKTLGDERMVHALENAERLTTALTLLDTLERKGALDKIMAALCPASK